jgi:hypothetical protein
MFPTIRENGYGFAREVRSASEPKARVTSARSLSFTHGVENSSENRRTVGIELQPYGAFSPDLEPSGYHLFRSMTQLLRGKSFNL